MPESKADHWSNVSNLSVVVQNAAVLCEELKVGRLCSYRPKDDVKLSPIQLRALLTHSYLQGLVDYAIYADNPGPNHAITGVILSFIAEGIIRMESDLEFDIYKHLAAQMIKGVENV